MTADSRAPMRVSVAELDAMHEASAAVLFEDCCGSKTWVRRMVDGRPYRALPALLRAADDAWASLGDDDRLEAFRAHPRIGQRRISGQSASSERMSAAEQSSSATASDAVKEEMARLNAEYERKFGHIFIICATGLSADAILDRLRARIDGSPGQELRNAAEEQRKITRLRLERVLEDG